MARVEPLADSITEERIAEIAFAKPPADLAIGELAEVTLRRGRNAPALVLPNAAIRRQGKQRRVEAGRRRAAVRAGAAGEAGLDGRVEVLSGLREGDRVVVYSEKELAPGSRISIVESLVR